MARPRRGAGPAHRVAVQRDIHTADPLYYATNAHNLAFHPAALLATRDHLVFVMRLGLTAPIALLPAVRPLDAGDQLPCLLAGLAIVAIAYAAATTPRARLLAVAFAAVCTPLVLDGRELTPDLPCAAAMAASILCLARRDRPRGAWWVTGAAVLWFAAFQIKEVAVWCAPAWIYAVIVDLRDRGGRWVVHAFAPAAAVGVALAAGYLGLCAALWGDPANLTIVMASQFAAAPPREPVRVRLLAQTERSGGTGKELARRAEALGLRPIAWHPEVRLYDAGDGARLRDALTGLP